VNGAGVVLGRLGGAAWTARGGKSVERLMETPTTYRPDNLLADLAGVMRRHRAPSLVITDADGVLVGVLSRRDAERRRAPRGPSGRRRRRATPGARN
jgi:CBS domain-containing protein